MAGSSPRRGPTPRPDLADLAPYRSSDLATGGIFLHANENPYPLPPAVTDEIVERIRGVELNRYPPPEPYALRDALAGYAGVDPAWVWVGDGSNEVLLQTCLAYGGPGRKALLFEPTYRMHHRQARIAGTEVVTCRRRDDFTIDVDDALDAIGRHSPDVVFACTPNNPTGTLTPVDVLERFAAATPGLLVVDEAYFEFCETTFVDRLADHPNVLVVRTLSKAFRLAGVRLGYGIAHPDVLDALARVRMPYGQSSFTQLAAEVVVRRRDEVLDTVGVLRDERDRVATFLDEVDGLEAFRSAANFLLFRDADPDAVLAACASAGIVVRDFRALTGCEGCLRVTIGTPEQNDSFIEAVSAAVGPRYHRGS